jgi:hypothetical protein
LLLGAHAAACCVLFDLAESKRAYALEPFSSEALEPMWWSVAERDRPRPQEQET